MYKKLPHLLLATMLGVAGAQAQQLPADVFKQMKARSIGPAVMSGRITAIDAVVSNPDIMYVGAASGGVWKSENGGVSWNPIFDDQPNINIGSIAVQQSNPSVLWVGTGEGNPRNSVNMGNGIYKSIDGGRTWKHMGLSKTFNIHRILIDPTNPDVVYAGVIGLPFGDHKERGVYKTTDGGKTWEQVLFTNEKSGVADMVMDPTNPNKLVVAMWQHRRTAWDFTSGGAGSGLYITYDGGKTWKKKTEADGLPKGDFGRIGIAMSRSMPNRIYALVEAGKNGLYRTDDGGEKWTKVTEDASIVTNRPFYFNEIFVDPKNENRIYMIYQPIAMSEDGGKSFKVIADLEKVHADHHAFWIHPENPNLIIDGNDGGVAISRDRGKTWAFPETIPIGQFYHVNVDNEVPYNIYGGLQDNGSWTGPAYQFSQGGIRNYAWQSVLYGDGFDVMPDPEDARYGYAMSQGGNLARYDKETGRTQFLKPTIADYKTKLRFNWNAAIAQDPFNKGSIYYGSQFVHKSNDKGMTWETISPDLTLNNPEHHKQNESGGLTLDITSAENHNTILTIAPSALQQGVIWAGTDDGNVHVTRDGGKTWTNVSKRLPGLPKEAWIPQITASRHNAGEAYVVANHYRAGSDFAPYIYRTTDFGKTWKRLVDEKQVKGYALSFLQDPTEPRLMFAGTEHGLWVSIDEGKNWKQWEQGIPATPVMDLAIQEREADLVIGTFGRSIFVLDNIRPLRKLAATGGKALEKPLVAFEASDAYLANYRNAVGYMNDTDNLYQAQNRPAGANLTYYIKPKQKPEAGKTSGAAKPAKKKEKKVTVNKETGAKMATTLPAKPAVEEKKTAKTDTVYVRIYNDANQHIRTLQQVPDSTMGVQRLTWNLTEKGLRQPGSNKPKKTDAEPSGSQVLPGRYKLVFSYAGAKDSTFINVQPDPRVPFNKEALVARRAMQDKLNQHSRQLTEATDRLQEATDATELLLTQLKDKNGKEFEDLRKATKAIQDSLKTVKEDIVGKKLEKQGYGRPNVLNAVTKLREASSYVSGRTDAPTQTETQLVAQADEMTREALTKVNQFFTTQWAEYRKKVEATPITVVKAYSEIAPTSLD
ncbi:exo-alpha-sialidase [Pontibacter ruber]|uniref:Sortilin N-terminal domain-containing protein n=1 Tax=Pontibacter ruber TaxID=1343895 RepID=A0ABW5CZP3_9BACT|nr:exo-alpha-sialidase [Pontibacter ruber]